MEGEISRKICTRSASRGGRMPVLWRNKSPLLEALDLLTMAPERITSLSRSCVRHWCSIQACG